MSAAHTPGPWLIEDPLGSNAGDITLDSGDALRAAIAAARGSAPA